jgi:two-component system cell cycle sensor histidine kinase/response regulator CckA
LRKFDVVVTDVILPGQNGYDLVENLRALVPDLSVLYVSGYAPEALRARGIPMADGAFLEKPFAPVTLVERLQRVLARRPVAKARGVA